MWNRVNRQILALSRLADTRERNGEPDPLAISREAVELIPRMRLKYSYELADALERLAERLRAAGCLEDAVTARQASIAVFEAGPRDSFEVTQIGGSRWELAEDQLALGRNEDAIATAERSVADWNSVRDEHEYHVLGVGSSLNLLARALGTTGRWDAALGAADQAIAIFRANGGGPDLTDALAHRADALRALGAAQ
jgi:tetratricopeptide (TPR) repeat protein